MKVDHYKNCEDVKIESFPFKGRMLEVKGTSIRWLSRYGDDGNGYPEYGLRYFTVEPGGEIPIHNHFYHQTMYILKGKFECYEFDFETEAVTQKAITGPDEFIYVKSMVPHGMKNIGNEPGAFLCAIANVYED
jgi:quercetin dioxygenase-like cupin family protein